MKIVNRREFVAAVAGAVVAPSAMRRTTGPLPWKAGTASVDITPRRSLWMAGFAAAQAAVAGRRAAAARQGARLEDVPAAPRRAGHRRSPRCHHAASRDRIAVEVQRRHGMARANLLFNASHTHCGPVIDEQLSVAYDLSITTQWTRLRAYTAGAGGQTRSALIGDAVRGCAGARSNTRAAEGRDFAANRRVQFSRCGPVDHSRPRAARGRPATARSRSSSATPATTPRSRTTSSSFHGDYAGVAQAALEARHPGATALFMTGCGGDANPEPRARSSW